MRTRTLSPPILLAAAFLLAAMPAFAQPGANAGPAKARATTPEIPFESVPNFFKLPAGLYMGEGTGVATNSKGHVFVYVRSGETRLFEFDQTGAFVKEIGAGSYGFSFAHAVRVDKDDNIWATDKGSDMIIKFNPQGRVTMVFGRKSEASDVEAKPHERNPEKPLPHQDGRFRQPTDVAWGPDGTIYISDGYVNSRVAKISKDGDWIKSWASVARVRASSTSFTASRPTPRVMSMSATAIIAASRFSMATATSCAR